MYSFGETIALIVTAAIYLAAGLVAIRKRGLKEATTRALLLFSIVIFMWVILQGILHREWITFPQSDELLRLPYLFLGLSGLLFVNLTRVFLRLKPMADYWWWIGFLWVAGLMFADFLLPDVVLVAASPISIPLTIAYLSIATWGVGILRCIVLVGKDYRRRSQPLHRNRISYWAFAVLLILGGGTAFAVNNFLLEGILLSLGGLLGAYALLTHRPVDLRVGILRLLSYVVTSGILIALYAVGYALTQFFIQSRLGYSPIVAGVLFAALIVILFRPLFNRIEVILEGFITGDRYDNNKTIRDYSSSISNILNLDLLSTVITGLVSEVMENQQGLLFTIDRDKNLPQSRTKYFYLRSVGGMGKEQSLHYKMPSKSPIALYLTKTRNPLIQYDIDFLDQFQSSSDDERAFFSSLGMDVYVPIMSNTGWIGLLAVGPKQTGVAYTEQDLLLLSTLADQTAVALENARLVTDIIAKNTELEEAYQQLNQQNTKLEEAYASLNDKNREIAEAYNQINKANQDLEFMDQAKTDFISIASHELRTPLTVMSGYSQMLAEDPTFAANAYYHKIIKGIYNGTERLNEIVESMLDVAKIDNRELEISPQPIALAPVIERVMSTFAQTVQERNLKVEAFGADSLPKIEADHEAMQKVFSQLLGNAIKYTPDGGSIQILCKEIDKSNESINGAGVQIIVSDTGIGIAPEHQDLIFRKFYQTGKLGLHSSGKTKFKGAGPGLGLAIAQGIIAAHHGKIWVESPGYDEENPPGSQFIIQLPLYQPAMG